MRDIDFVAVALVVVLLVALILGRTPQVVGVVLVAGFLLADVVIRIAQWRRGRNEAA